MGDEMNHRLQLGICAGVFTLVLLMVTTGNCAPGGQPVRIGLTAEFGLKDSTSAQAVEMGIRVALSEINAKGGVLGGRPLVLETLDDRSIPARSIENVRKFTAQKDMVAVFGARFTPVVLELLPVIHELGMILLDPWASGDGVTQHNFKPSYTFRLSLMDRYAMPHMIRYAEHRGFKRVGLLLPNTAWGRGNDEAARTYLAKTTSVTAVLTRWYNWGDKSFGDLFKDLIAHKAQCILLVANDAEGSLMMHEYATMPEAKSIPILCHWGVTGGNFFEKSREDLKRIDFSVVQTFSFMRADPQKREQFMAIAKKLYPGLGRAETILAPVGVGHAYDLTHLLALAIDKAGSTDRAAVRKALENLGPYSGLVANLNRPFSPSSHDALGAEVIFMAKYRDDGVLVPLP